MLANLEELSKLDLCNIQMDFDANSLNRSATLDDISIHPQIQTGFDFRPLLNDTLVTDFNIISFNKDGNDSEFLEIKYYNPPNLIFRHLPIKEKIGNSKVKRMRIGYIIDTLTLLAVCEIVNMRCKVNQTYEGVIYTEKNIISF